VNIHHPQQLRRRAFGAYCIVALVVGVLMLGFFRIQVLGGTSWELRAASNRIRTLPVPAPRGTIYDRNGRIVADNVPGYSITIVPGPADSVRATLERMSRHVELSEQRMDQLMGTLRAFGREIVVDSDADFEVVAALEERRADFPGVYVEMRPRRRYLTGTAAGHLTGYVGEITAQELGTEAFPESAYEAGMIVGKVGIERQYEERLQGRRGVRYVEFDARGRIVGDFEGVEARPAEPGQDLVEHHGERVDFFPGSTAGGPGAKWTLLAIDILRKNEFFQVGKDIRITEKVGNPDEQVVKKLS